MAVHGHFSPTMDHLSAYYTLHMTLIVLNVLYIQVYYLLGSPGV